MRIERVLIMGAAGRDFHDFNVVYRDDPSVEVVAFTATQIPGIADRRYPTELAGERYPAGIPIRPEAELETLIRDLHVDTVVFAYSDVSHEQVMHAASRVLAAGADFALLGTARTMLESTRPVVSVCAVRTNAAESAQLGRILAAKVNEATGPSAVVLPLGGLSKYELPGGPFRDLAADEALFAEVRSTLRPDIVLREVDANVNDPAFAEAVLEVFRERWTCVRPLPAGEESA